MPLVRTEYGASTGYVELGSGSIGCHGVRHGLTPTMAALAHAALAIYWRSGRGSNPCCCASGCSVVHLGVYESITCPPHSPGRSD